MTILGGGSFDLTSFLASTWNTVSQSITVLGTLSGGGTVSSVFTLGNTPSAFSVGFSDVTSVDFYTDGGGLQLDDLSDGISAQVPLPASLPLLLVGIGALGRFRKRQRKPV